MADPQLKKSVGRSFEEVLGKVPEALKSEGFGILTEIDVTGTLKEKLDVSFRRYRILGACNPPLAHRALQADLDVGLLLPCNVLVYELDEGGTAVSAVDPMEMVADRDDPELRDVALAAREKLARAIALVS